MITRVSITLPGSVAFTAVYDARWNLIDRDSAVAALAFPTLLSLVEHSVAVGGVMVDLSGRPRHLAPDACYICGGGSHTTRDGGHEFWTNAAAQEYFADLDAVSTFVYSSGERTVEGKFVNETRGR